MRRLTPISGAVSRVRLRLRSSWFWMDGFLAEMVVVEIHPSIQFLICAFCARGCALSARSCAPSARGCAPGSVSLRF